MEINKKNIIGFIKNYKYFFLIFIIFLIINIYQTTMFFWDPFVYHLNGQWFCGNQVYFEFLRPPFPSGVNCLTGGGENSILFTQIVASITYFIAGIVLFKKELKTKKLDQLFFVLFFFLAPQIILFGNYGGDYFALAFLVLALSVNGFKKGILFGLATLSRYNFFFFIILLIDYKKLKAKELISLVLGIVLVWAPWLIYNFARTKNMFFSIEETIWLNISMKGVFAPIEVSQILLIAFFLLIFLINFKKNMVNKKAQAGIISIILFFFSGIKEARFLNVLVPFQATKISELVYNKNKLKLIFGVVMILMLISYFFILTSPRPQKEIPNDLVIFNCKVMSDHWVYLYTKGIVAEPLPRNDSFKYFLEDGRSLLIYDKEIDDSNFNEYEIIKNNEFVLIKPNNCSKQLEKYELFVWRGNNSQ